MAGTRNYQRRNFAQFEPTPLNEHLVLPLAFQKKADDTRLSLANRVNELAQQQVRGADIAVRDQMIKGFQDEVAGTLDSYNGDVARASKEIVPMIGAARNNPAWNEMIRLNKDKEEFDKFKRNAEANGKVVHDLGFADSTPLMNEDGTLNNVQYQPKVFEGNYRPFMEAYVNDIKADSEASQTIGKIKELASKTGVLGDVNTIQGMYQVLEKNLGVDLADKAQGLVDAYVRSDKGKEQIERKILEGVPEAQALEDVSKEMFSAITEVEYNQHSKETDVKLANLNASGMPSSMYAALAAGAAETNGNLSSTVVSVNAGVAQDYADSNPDDKLLVSGVIAHTDYQPKPLSKQADGSTIFGITGFGGSPVYAFQPKGNIFSDENQGAPSDNLKLYNAETTGNNVIPVSTGLAYNGAGEPVSDEQLKSIPAKRNYMVTNDTFGDEPEIIMVSTGADGQSIIVNASQVNDSKASKNPSGKKFDKFGNKLNEEENKPTKLAPGKYVRAGNDVYLKVEDKVFTVSKGNSEPDGGGQTMTVYQQTNNSEAAFMSGKSNTPFADIKVEGGKAMINVIESSTKSGESAIEVSSSVLRRLNEQKQDFTRKGDFVNSAKAEQKAKTIQQFIINLQSGNRNFVVDADEENGLYSLIQEIQGVDNKRWEQEMKFKNENTGKAGTTTITPN